MKGHEAAENVANLVEQENGKARIHVAQYTDQVSIMIDPAKLHEIRLSPERTRQLCRLLKAAADSVSARKR